MRFAQIAFILLLIFTINSCTLVKTAYNNAPQALSWWLDNYFDFNRSQQSVLNPALNRLHDWHRQNQLPDYIATLKDLQNSLAQPQITSDVACEKLDEIKASFSELQAESAPIIIEMAPLLSDKQMQYFRKKLDDRAIKWKSEWWQDSSEEQLEVRLEKMEDFSEKMYGRLNASQQTLLKQKLSAIAFNPELSYTEILRRHDDTEQIINKLRNANTSNEEKLALVKNGFERLRNSPNAQFQTYAEQHQQNICGLFADLHNSTDSKQKQHANQWLEKYIVQLTSLTQVNSAK